MAEVRRGTVLSFSASDWTALVQLDGADAESQMQVGVWVQAQMMTAGLEVACLVFGDTNTDDGIVLGPYGTTGLQNLHTAADPTFDGLNLGTGTGATTGRIVAKGAASGSTLLDLIPNTGALADAGYIFVDSRLRIGWDGSKGIIDDNGGGKSATISFGNNVTIIAGGILQLTAEVRASDLIRLGGNTDTLVTQQKISGLAVLSTATLLGGSARAGLLTIVEANAGRCAIYYLKGGIHATQEVSDPDAVYSTAKGTATSHNIYWSGSVYELENHSAGTDTYWITFMGI